MRNTNSNIRLINPNKDSTNNRDTTLDTSKLTINVSLESFTRDETVIIAEGDFTKVESGSEFSKVDYMSGNKLSQNSNYSSFSTLYTELNNAYNTNNGKYRDLETLGITNIDIGFDTSSVPVITITMFDVRGRLFYEGNESPLSSFFKIPYPIFKLKVKGFLGKTVTYDLNLMEFNSSFNADQGGFEITCKFIGYKYAFLSDMLIGYLRAVVYTKQGKAFLEELGEEKSKTFEDLNNSMTSFKEIILETKEHKTQKEIDDNSFVMSALDNIINSIQSDFSLKITNYDDSIFNDNNTIKPRGTSGMDSMIFINRRSNGTEINTINSQIDSFIEVTNNSINEFNEKFNKHNIRNIKRNEICYGGKVNIIQETSTSARYFKYCEILNEQDKNYEIKKAKLGDVTINDFDDYDANLNYPTLTIYIFDFIDYLKTYKDELMTKNSTNKEDMTQVFDSKIKQNMDVDLSIGGYFEVLCNHADILMKTIAKVAQEANNEVNRTSKFKNTESIISTDTGNSNKIYAFPEYKVKDVHSNNEGISAGYTERYVAEGLNSGEQIPETIFVEELIKGFLKVEQEDVEMDRIINEAKEGLTFDFTPIHQLDDRNGNMYNPYSTIDSIKNDIDLTRFLLYRSFMFLIAQNVEYNLPNEVLEAFVEIEFNNIETHLNQYQELLSKVKARGVRSDSIFKDLYDDKTLVKHNVNNNRKYEMVYNTNLISGSYTNTAVLSQTPNFNPYFIDDNTISGLILSYNNGESSLTNRISMSGRKNMYSERFYPFEIYDSEKNGAQEYEVTNLSPLVKEYNVSGTNILSAPFSIDKGYPYLTKVNDIDINLAFLKENKNNDTIINNMGYYINDSYQTVFGSEFYLFQENDSSKALAFLMSIGFNFINEPYGSFNMNLPDELYSLFSVRSSTIKANYLWCALLGGVIKAINNEIKLTVGIKTNIELINGTINDYSYFANITNDNQIIKNDNGRAYWNFIEKNRPTSNNTNSIKMPYELFEDGSTKGSLSLGNDEQDNYLNLTSFISNLDEKLKLQLTDIFDDFLSDAKLNLFPISNFFTGNITDNYSDYLTFINSFWDTDNKISISEGKEAIRDYQYDSLFKRGEKLGYFNNKNNFVYNYQTFTSRNDFKKNMFSTSRRTVFSWYNTPVLKDSELYGVLSGYINRSVDFKVYTAGYFNRDNSLYDSNNSNTINYEMLNSSVLQYNLDKIEELFKDKFKGLITTTDKINNESSTNEFSNNFSGYSDSNDLRLKVYKDIKNIYDKWISGKESYEIANESGKLYDSFKFVSRSYDDISEAFKINLFTVYQDISRNYHQPLYGHISKVLSFNNFNFLPMPVYVDLGNDKEIEDMFKPIYYRDSLKSSEVINPTFMCMYVGEMSSKLDLGKNNRYRSDGVQMSFLGNDEATILNADDFGMVETMPIILIRYGDENQSIFKDISFNQSDMSVTNESLINTENIIKNTGLHQNLFNIYSNRSYSISIRCLGNAMIQPFMYIYLDGIPMIYGLYLITKVSHNITPNGMVTEFKAQRVRDVKTKMVDIRSLYYSIFTESTKAYNSSNSSTPQVKTTSKYSNSQSIKGQGLTFIGGIDSKFRQEISKPLLDNNHVSYKSTDGSNYGLPSTIDYIYKVAQKWNSIKSKYDNIPPNLMVNALSPKYGGGDGNHNTHQIGTSIDFRLINIGSKSTPSNVGDANYHADATKELVRIMLEVASEAPFKEPNKNTAIRVIYINDTNIQELNKGLVKYWKGHGNHIHVELNLPDKYKKYSVEGGYQPEEEISQEIKSNDSNVGDLVEYKDTLFDSSDNNLLENSGKIENLIGMKTDLGKTITAHTLATLDILAIIEGTSGKGMFNGYDVLFKRQKSTQSLIGGYELNTTKIKHRGKAGSTNTGDWTTKTNTGANTGAMGRYQILYNSWIEGSARMMKAKNEIKTIESYTNPKYNNFVTKYNQDYVGCILLGLGLNMSKKSMESLSSNVTKKGLYDNLKSISRIWESANLVKNNEEVDKIFHIDRLHSLYLRILEKYKK